MKFAILVFITTLSVGCSSHRQSEAELRLRRYFHVNNNVPLESKPSPLLAGLPVGTPEKEIYAFLDENGVGKDGMSSYTVAGERGEIFCRVEYDLRTPEYLKEHFGVLIRLDDERKLREIVVMRWQTGT